MTILFLPMLLFFFSGTPRSLVCILHTITYRCDVRTTYTQPDPQPPLLRERLTGLVCVEMDDM